MARLICGSKVYDGIWRTGTPRGHPETFHQLCHHHCHYLDLPQKIPPQRLTKLLEPGVTAGGSQRDLNEVALLVLLRRDPPLRVRV